MCKHYNVSPRKGDILFIRTGVIPEWDSLSETQKIEYAAQKEPKHAGVEACMETLEWLWDSGIAAVAGDAISWEVRPLDFGRLLLENRRLVSLIKLTGYHAGLSYPWRGLDSRIPLVLSVRSSPLFGDCFKTRAVHHLPPRFSCINFSTFFS